MQRVVTAEMDLELGASVDLIFQIAAAQAVPISSEQLTFTQGDRVYTPTEIVDQSGSRLHRLTGEPGRLEIRYEATVDGQPLEATWLAGAGMDETLADGIPRVRLSAQISPTRTLTIDLQLTPRTFEVGTTPFHGIEKVGFVNVVDTMAGFLPGGFVSDGAVELDSAGTEAGAAVTGRFSGRLLQFGCITL